MATDEEFLQRLETLLAAYGCQPEDSLLRAAADAAERQIAGELGAAAVGGFLAARLDLAAALYLRGEAAGLTEEDAGDVKAVRMGDVSLDFGDSSRTAARLLRLADEFYRSAMVQLAGERGVRW